MQKLEILEINEEQANSAKRLASTLSEPRIRKRGLIDMLGINCAINYLHAKKIKTDTRRSVYKIPVLFEEFKISDIYCEGYRVDVITLFKEKSVKIPKIHVDMDIMPHYYFIVQIGSRIKEAKMIGFIEARSILRCSHDSKFYYPSLDLLMSLDKFQDAIKAPVVQKPLLGKHIDCLGLFLKFIDNDLSSAYKRQLIQHLLSCDACRARFMDALEFERLARGIRFYPDLIGKQEPKIVDNIEFEPQEQSKFLEIEKEDDELEAPKKISTSMVSGSVVENEIEELTQDETASCETQEIPPVLEENADTPKKVIDTIFNEIPKIELPALKTITNVKNKHLILTFALIFIVLGSFALIAIKGTSDAVEENKNITNLEQYNENYDYEDYSYPSGRQARLIPKQNEIDDFIIKQPISTRPTYSPGINKVSWEAPESIVKKPAYVRFLQLTGKNVKLNLQNDLLLVNDIPVNKHVKVDIVVSSGGDVNSIKLISSSGSDAIDASVKKVVTDTLTYMKPPQHGIISRPVNITLTVELN